ncbi:MAG: VIT1/CCC1 transporter family protein [Methanobacteriaceae archaeon]|nr:VIT1/CCC1 transporter family protein [Methanobacteriaceae archaeon]
MKITLRKVLKDYIAMSRYIALGSLDGILTVLSISLTAALISLSTHGHTSTFTVGMTGLSGGIAIALSNGFGSYIGERAEEGRTIRELESQMMLEDRKLDNTIINEKAQYRVRLSMLTHGSASFLGSFIPLLPFFLISDIYMALTVTIIICFIALASLGYYLGHVAKENIPKTVIQILAIGTLLVIISYLFGGA